MIFAGDPDNPDARSAQAKLLVEQLQAGGYAGPVTYLDIATRGTLSDLAQSRSDLAIIALPDDQLAAALEVACRIESKSALIISTDVDAALASELHTIAKRHGVHLLGPNCLGFQRPRQQLNASVLGSLAQPGSLALVSQSGALTASILDWAARNGVGFSNVVSLGPNTAVDVAQVLDFLADDRSTQSIVLYLEGIRNARRFMSSLRIAATAKPVIVLKAGRKPAGSSAALTHSGAIVGSDDVFDAALQRAGAVRVRSFVQLFSAAKCLSSRYLPVGKRLAIVTNGGGPGVLAADWANELGLSLAPLPVDAAKELKKKLAPHASLDTLVDLGEGAEPEQYREAMALPPGEVRVLHVRADRRATFRCVAGVMRPGLAVASGLLAAGDHVEGPYPATLEGAVMAGERAAAALDAAPAPQ